MHLRDPAAKLARLACMQFSSYDAALLCMRLLDWLASFGHVTCARSSDGCIQGCRLCVGKKRGWGEQAGVDSGVGRRNTARHARTAHVISLAGALSQTKALFG